MKDAGEYVDPPEITVRKIKAAVIANKKAVEFHQADTSDCDDSDASSYIEPYEDVNISDPELIKIAQFCKALPNFFLSCLALQQLVNIIKKVDVRVQDI